MGSFYSTCCLSNATIRYGTPFTRIYLVPSAMGDSESLNKEDLLQKVRRDKIWLGSREHYWGKGLAVSNDGAYAMYCPYGFPIHYKYDDYGRGDIINTDENKRNLQNILDSIGIDYNSLDYAASDDRWMEYGDDSIWKLKANPKPERVNLLKHLTYCDIYTPVYKFFCKKVPVKEWYDNYPNKQINTLRRVIEERPQKLEHNKKMAELYPEDADLWNSVESVYFSGLSFIPQLCDYNFIQHYIEGNLFDLSKDEIALRTMMDFSRNVSYAYLILRPSHYGGQEVNYKWIKGMGDIVKKMR